MAVSAALAVHDPSLLPQVALTATTVYLALHHLALWAGRRRFPMHGWIAAWCAGSFVVGASRIAHYAADDVRSAVAALKVTTAVVPTLALLLVGFCRDVAGDPLRPRTVGFATAALVPLTALILLTDAFVTRDATWVTTPLGDSFWWVQPGPALPVLGPAALALLVYCVGRLRRAPRLSAGMRRVLVGALSLYALVGMNDLLTAMGVIASIPLFEYSFALLALAFDLVSVRHIHDLNDEMESRVTDRTASLAVANASLEQALADARSAADAKSAFLANMSHEIRTPMNGVMGMTALLMETRLTPEQHGYAGTIRDSADALLTIVNDILDFSKIEAGRLALERVTFDAWWVTEEVVHLLSERAREQQVELACEVDEDVPRWVVGDPGRVRQVLVNLVGNAIKFTRDGSVFVRVSRVATDGRDKLRFEVTDTGIGVAPEQLATAFRPFSQGDSSTTRKYGGTGLGLAICKQLAELMAGEIGATSEPGVGSTFWFTVTLRRDDDRSHTNRSGQLVSGHALVASASPGIARMLRYQLASYGLEVDAVPAGAARGALARLRATGATGYRFAFLDRSRGDDDAGADLAACLRSDPPARVFWLCPPTESIDSLPTGIAGRLSVPTRRDRVGDVVGVFTDRSSEPSVSTRPSLGAVDVVDGHPRRRVLVAEDNLVNQRVARRMLEGLDCEVTLVASGRAAVEAASVGAFDLVLMDCQMPDMDGFDATTVIRSGPMPRPDLPIVAMTASALPEDRARCLAAGMNDFLTKPFRPQDLKRVVERWSRSGESAA